MIDAVTVTPLCRRMIEDIAIRRLGEHTQRDYVRRSVSSRLFWACCQIGPSPRVYGATSFTWLRWGRAIPE